VTGLSGKQYQTVYDGVITVPDGMWVAEVESSDYLEYVERYDDELGEFESVNSWEYEVIGTNNFKRHILDYHSRGGYSHGYKSSWARSLIVSDSPFGIVCWQSEYNQDGWGRYFTVARQIHKGDLGTKPQIERPKFARQSSEPHGFGHQKKVHQHGWARLMDVARLAHMERHEMLRLYFAFTHAECPHLDVIIAQTREAIHSQCIPHNHVLHYGWDKLVEMFDTHNQSDIWIRQGFAVTLLYLRHFGYVPRQAKVGNTS
jgi:hypothetical protein